MKILSIASILPIPGIISTNDFVFQIYSNYKKVYKNDEIVIIRPVRYDFNIFSILKRDTRLIKLKGKLNWTINNFQVEIFPFLSWWSSSNIHALITATTFWFNKRRISKLFAVNHFKIVHAQYIFSDGILAYLISKKYKIPYMITTHNERRYFDHWISKKIATKILKNAAQVVPINYTNYLYFKSLGLNNVFLTPLGFNSAFLKAQSTRKSERIRILTVSVLTKLKNIDKVITAMKDLVTRYEITYTVIGRGPEKESLLKLVETLELTDYVNFVDQVPHELIAEEMYKHDIFIMTSYFETFGRVYFEAMAMGIPIICAKKSGIHGIFKEGDEGLSVDHSNIAEISKALEFLIQHPDERIRIGLNGQNLVRKYTWENIVKDLHDKYQLFKNQAPFEV